MRSPKALALFNQRAKHRARQVGVHDLDDGAVLPVSDLATRVALARAGVPRGASAGVRAGVDPAARPLGPAVPEAGVRVAHDHGAHPHVAPHDEQLSDPTVRRAAHPPHGASIRRMSRAKLRARSDRIDPAPVALPR